MFLYWYSLFGNLVLMTSFSPMSMVSFSYLCILKRVDLKYFHKCSIQSLSQFSLISFFLSMVYNVFLLIHHNILLKFGQVECNYQAILEIRYSLLPVSSYCCFCGCSCLCSYFSKNFFMACILCHELPCWLRW